MDNKAKYLIIGSCIAPIVFFLTYSLFTSSAACDHAEDFKKENYSGILVKKYRDQNNHRIRTLKIEKNGYIKELLIFLDTNFYNNLEIGDVLIKKENQELIQVSRGDTSRVFKINFGCSE